MSKREEIARMGTSATSAGMTKVGVVRANVPRLPGPAGPDLRAAVIVFSGKHKASDATGHAHLVQNSLTGRKNLRAVHLL